MTTTRTIRTIAGAAIAAGAMLFMTMPGGAAHAEGRMSHSNNLKQIGLAVHDSAMGWDIVKNGQFDGGASDADIDGRDFLVWQRGGSPAPIGTGDLADWQSNYGVGAAASDTDGRDFLIWQRTSSAAPVGDTGNHEVGHWMGMGGY